MTNKKPLLAILLAGILWGLIGIFLKHLSAAGLDSLDISMTRMLVSSVSFSAVVFCTDKKAFRIRLKDMWMFVCTGIVSVVLFNFFYFYTTIHSQSSVAVVLLYTSPIFIILLQALLYKKKVVRQEIAAVACAFMGCVCVSGVIGASSTRISPLILTTGLLSGLFYALYTIFGNIALRKYSTTTVTVYTFIFGFLGMLCTGRMGNTIAKVCAEPSLVIWYLGIGIICTVLPYFLYTWGLTHVDATKAGILVAVEPLVAAVIGMTVYQENHGLFKIFGIGLILLSVILVSFGKKSDN